MALQCGIVGLPNVGKSTLFNALTKSSVPAENYPFCTIDPHLGIVELPDSRLEKLAEIYKPDKVTPAVVEFIDIAGLVSGASRGEGLGNQFLGQIRQVAAIIHVVRCFKDSDVIHVEGNVNPVRDAELIEMELLLADIETIVKRRSKADKAAKSGDKNAKKELDIITRLLEHCNNGHRARTFETHGEESTIIRSLHLLTQKPILYVANVDDTEITHNNRGEMEQQLVDFAEKEGNLAIRLCGKLEQEIAVLSNDEKGMFLEEYNLSEPGLNKVIQSSFNLLGLQTFFTCGEQEVRSWTIRKGELAPEAAGTIHSDFERGFIKAEIFKYNDIIKYKSENKLKELGLIKQEGKNYIMKYVEKKIDN